MVGEVIDCYKLLEELGQGGMGLVYKALDTSLERVVALKVMHPMLARNERFSARFRSEAKALGRLHHPHIVDVYAFRQQNNHFFIVMEFVDGESLGQHLKRRGAVPWREAVPLIIQTLDAIDYAHQQKIIHRDIKPGNILITHKGIAKITDFGLAKIQDVALTRTLTATGITGGSLYYMPPEQLEGLAAVDHRGDIYSLGMTYYEMLVGRSPFAALSSEFAVLKAIDAHDFPSLGELNKDVPAPLVRIVMKALEREPADRYQSAGEMLATLRDALGQPAPGTPPAARADETLTYWPDDRAAGVWQGATRPDVDPAAADPDDLRQAFPPLLGKAPASKDDPYGLTDTTIGPYHILEHLGGGGMGIVYKAEDTRLGRPVALKLLPPRLSTDEGARRRFMQEAKAASALDHTNICTIYEIGQSDFGVTYIAMAFYQGETLKKKIARGPLPVEQALDYAAQMAHGLAQAHAAGIVHRDVKPANAIVTDEGVVKMLDFGLAKMADVHLTRTGMRLGTMAYMSPEQTRGEEVDARTDLWALGVVLYEMVTGERPFRDDARKPRGYTLLYEDPVPLTQVNPALPEALERVVGRCLEKNRDQRYPAMADLLADLERLTRAPDRRVAFPPEALPTEAPSREALPTETPPVSRFRKVLPVAAVLLGGLLLYGVLKTFIFVGSQTATLTIRTDPAAAQVSVNGQPAGSTPLDYEVNAGNVALHVEKDGYLPLDTVLTAAADETPVFEFSLTAVSDSSSIVVVRTDTVAVAPTGVLSLESSPSGARIFVDGVPQGTTPGTIRDVSVGQHTITLKLDYHETYTRSVRVVEGQTRSVKPTLAPLMGELTISVRPWGRLSVDGASKRDRVSFKQTLELPAGRHTVTVENPELGRWERPVVVTPGAPQQFHIDFTRQVTVRVNALDTELVPVKGEIFVDGQPMGEVPRDIEVRVGVRKIEVRADGYGGDPHVSNFDGTELVKVVITLRKEDR